jgi:predicted PurR-regulated permease PerM
MSSSRDEDKPLVPVFLQAAAGWCWRLLVIGVTLAAVGMVAKKLELVLIPLFTAVLLTGLLQPINSRLRRAHFGRGPAATVTVLLAVAVLGGVGAFVANRAASGYPELVTQINALVTRTQNWLVDGPLHLDRSSVANVGDQIINYLRSRQGQILSSAVSAGRTILDMLTALVLTFFFTIFLLYDGPRIFRWLTAAFPVGSRAKVDEVGDRMWETVSGYVSGTFIVAVFHGVAMSVTLVLVGVPLVAPLAVLIFIGAFIPLIGAIVFGGLAVLVTFVTNGVTAGVIVLVVLVVENQVEGHVLQPFVVGRHVNLHPMAIAFTLTAGAILAGLPGAIFGVPLVAAVNAAAKALRGKPEPEEPAPEEAAPVVPAI